jgi:hypothetical protein
VPEHWGWQIRLRISAFTVRAAGRGKSTLARVLFKRRAYHFSHSTFVEIQEGDGREKTVHYLAAALQGLGAAGRADEGASVLSSRLKAFVRNRKVLLVLDNVWTASQLDALLPTAWGAGSIVIVTSRSAGFPDSDAWRQVRPFTNCDWTCDRTVSADVHARGKCAPSLLSCLLRRLRLPGVLACLAFVPTAFICLE